MYQEYMKNWVNVVNNLQKPLQEIIELNARTWRSINYLKPQELIQIRKPSDLVEKQVNIAVENGHIALNYMQNSFAILESNLLNLSNDIKSKTREAVNKTQSKYYSSL